MRDLYREIQKVDLSVDVAKADVISRIVTVSEKYGLHTVDVVMDKPWGAMVRFDNSDARLFLQNFFPERILEDSLEFDDRELSPKFLLVNPGGRLSWQRHSRRSERWLFLTEGGYHKSDNASYQGDLIGAELGEVVQFNQGQCHRLVGAAGERYTLVAEVWQHIDSDHPSDEDDIERISDDYDR